MGLLDDCQTYFETSDLYQVLKVKKESSDNEIKRAYHKISLKIHPDRVSEGEKEEATKKFQVLGKAYGILSNDETRKIYNETGEVDDESSVVQDRDWYEYWRLLFAKVSVKDIEEFTNNYKDSEEELKDLKAAYTEYVGDMDKIIDSVLCATTEDEARFTTILKDLVSKGELPPSDKFSKESKTKKRTRQKKAAQEAAEAEELKSELGIGTDDSLKSMIMQRHSSRQKESDNFFAQLEAKYAQPKKKKTKKTK